MALSVGATAPGVTGGSASNAVVVGCASETTSTGTNGSLAARGAASAGTGAVGLESADVGSSFENSQKPTCGDAVGVGIATLNTSSEESRVCGFGQGSAPFFRKPSICLVMSDGHHSHSIVAGGLLDTSYTTRLIPRTSLIIREEIRASNGCGSGAQSAVMKSNVCTARSATTYS